MAFMDYMPQFSQNLPQDNPMAGDDTLMQIDLKRKLALADQLRQAQMPEGQMVSGRYVAPAWTQVLANALGKVQAGNIEKKAYEQYGQAQQAKQKKLSDLLQGKEVTAPVDYNEAGNMPGMEQTTRQPYSQQEFLSKAVGVMPELAPKLIESQVAQYTKDRTPIKGSEGDVFFDPITHEQVFAVPKTVKEQEMFGKVNPGDFTPASLAKFSQSKDYRDLVPVSKQQTETNVGKLMAEMNALPPNDPRRAFYQQAIRKETTVPQDFTQQTFKYNQARGLREDFAGLPEVKAWNVIQPTLVAARQAAKDTSGGSDLNLIYAMGKIMDPNSVVREGELQMAGDTGSLGQKIMGYYKSVAKGGKLPQAVKQDLLSQIESRAKAQESLYKNTKAKYTDIARRNQINPEDLFVEGITSPSNTVNFGDLK